jgi:hypothetical protein
MTLKIKTSKATMKQPVNNQPGFTMSENFLIDHLETKKKTKHAAKATDEQGSKVGKMFKKKKAPAAMEEDDGFEIVKEEKIVTKKSKPRKAVAAAAIEEGDVPGFSAPKEAKKRKMEGDKTEAKKAKKAEVPEKKEVSKKELKVERKKKENSTRYDLSVKAKKVWEELRREETPKDKQLSLGAQLFAMTKGHLLEVCLIYILSHFDNAFSIVSFVFDNVFSWSLRTTRSALLSACLKRLLKTSRKLFSMNSRVTQSIWPRQNMVITI